LSSTEAVFFEPSRKRLNIVDNKPLSFLVDPVQIETEIELTKTTIALLFLLNASLSDWKNREVSDATWAVMAPLGLALTLIEMYINGFSQLPFVPRAHAAVLSDEFADASDE
jgi:hypothetical protein